MKSTDHHEITGPSGSSFLNTPVLTYLRRPSSVVWIIALLAIPCSRLASPNFPSSDLFNNVMVLGLFLAIVAFGQGLVILTGGLDLSVAISVTLGAYFTGYLASSGMPLVAAAVVALLVTGLLGLINGVLMATTPFPAFIVTLATSAMAASLLLGLSAGAPSQRAPQDLARLFDGSLTTAGIPVAVLLFAAVVIIGVFLQSATVFGRHAYAVGDSPRAALISGIPVKRTIILAYVTAGISYGVAGIMLLGYGSGADLNVGNPWLLPSIAAVVVGGSSIKGGAGSFWGTVGAVFLLTILTIDISAAGISEGFKQIAYGAVILVALLGGKLAAAKR
ncbi:ABC transporter permease [Arthrobacter sp. SA17]